jgi:hypothetical protein
METNTKPGVVLKKVDCYSTNVGEMAKELYTALIDPQTDELKEIDLKTAITAIQAAYDQARETIYECNGGETFEVELPDTFTGNAIELLLGTLGLQLNKPVTPDSPVV